MNQNGEVIESWLSAMVFVARHYRIDYSEENVRVAMQWEKNNALNATLQSMARQLSLAIQVKKFTVKMLDPWRMPLVVELTGGQIGVLTRMDAQNNISVVFHDDNGIESVFTKDELSASPSCAL